MVFYMNPPSLITLSTARSEVRDWHAVGFYTSSPTDNPTGPESGTYKVYHGGGWGSNWVFIRVASRSYDPAFNGARDSGFRCASSDPK